MEGGEWGGICRETGRLPLPVTFKRQNRVASRFEFVVSRHARSDVVSKVVSQALEWMVESMRDRRARGAAEEERRVSDIRRKW